MSQICFYGVKVRGGRIISAKEARQDKLTSARFSSLTPKSLSLIPALAGAADVRDRLEILPVHPVSGQDQQVPVECLEEALGKIELDTRGMAFVSRKMEESEGRPHTLAELLPYLRESIATFGEAPVQDVFAFPSLGTKSIRAYLEVLFHYGGPKPLSLHFDCFLKRDGALDKIRLVFGLGEIVDENTPDRFSDFQNNI
jgi:hypothetical protein